MTDDSENDTHGTPQPDDASVLAHFASKPEFAALSRAWSQDESSAFCRIARAVHAAGLDWWHTDIAALQIRFGRKEIGKDRAAGVLGYLLRKRPTVIEMNRVVDGVSDAHNGPLSAELADQIERLMSEERAALQTWMPAEHPRDGLWPDEIAGEGAVRAPAQDAPRFWIEKTIVAGRSDREQGDHALGRALWSPQRSKSGGDIYASMRAVRPGDVVFHLTDNQAITGVSIAAEAVDDSFQGLTGTDWEGPGYRIALRDHAPLSPPLDRAAFLATEPFATELSQLAKSGAKGLFYNAHRGLNQGAYLTEATPTLLSILSRAYQAFAGKPLPYVEQEIVVSSAPPANRDAYTLDDALKDLFLEQAEAEQIMLLWRAKRNIILQGPPGVGKSFAAQRLAFALIGAADRERLGFVQFHQSYSYEDFVEGYRPTADGFELRPGKFVEFCRRAEADPEHRYVFVIDEINRGNLSKIMGELMLLIEGDKRSPDWAIPLASGRVPFHVPSNVYLLGLMNTADRSLAVVDYALRRRFAFIDLAPKLTSPKLRWQLGQAGVIPAVVAAMTTRVGALNEVIVSDTANLGRGFEIGHSFFCAGPMPQEEGWDWYDRVIRTEVLPLLREYWFDAPAKVEQWESQLLAPL